MKETKDYILKKALVLFMQKSYKEVTMKDIVESTGLSKGAFYHYFESKESVFEAVVKYFYDEIMITDFSHFPTHSLKEFYHTYIDSLHTPNVLDTAEAEGNLFMFIHEASRKVSSFQEIHTAQRRKEVEAWSKVISQAKHTGEIRSAIPDHEIAQLFIFISDGVSMTTITRKPDAETLSYLQTSWNNLYHLLKGN